MILDVLFIWGGGGLRWGKQVQCMNQRKIWLRSLSNFGDCGLFSHANEELNRLWQGEDEDNILEPILDCIHHLRQGNVNSISTNQIASILSKLRRNNSFGQFEEAQAVKIWNTLQV